jgi:hypothetical protein
LENKEFVEIVQKSLTQVISLLFRNDVPFTILTNVSRVEFEPPLPEQIRGKFQPITLFALEGYTLSSVKIAEGVLSFEAGFGEDNFASFVSIPLGAVLQVAIGDRPIFLNMSVEDGEESETKIKPKAERENNSKRSMDALLSNPENENLFKK